MTARKVKAKAVTAWAIFNEGDICLAFVGWTKREALNELRVRQGRPPGFEAVRVRITPHAKKKGKANG